MVGPARAYESGDGIASRRGKNVRDQRQNVKASDEDGGKVKQN